MKWLNRKRILTAVSVLLLSLIALIAGGVYFLTSPEFEQFAADYIIRFIEERTGASVSMESFEADFAAQRFVLNRLVLRGEESPSEPPLVAVDRIEIGLRLRSLIGRKIDLPSLTVLRPRIWLTIDDNGETNMTAPRSRPEGGSIPLEVFIGDLQVMEGELAIGERRIDIDFTLAAVDGSFDYRETTGVLSGHLEYEGAVVRSDAPLIPYALAADFDYTNGIVLVHTANLRSGESSLALQGRIDDALESLRGVLEYSGVVDLPFLRYFLADEQFEGSMDVGGRLEFSTEHFASTGQMTSDRLSAYGWTAEDVASDFEYAFPERALRATGLEATVVGGQARGSIEVSPLPGSSRVQLDLAYTNVDTLELRRVYPWDSQYVLRSRATGRLEGWFEGAFRLYDLSGDATFEPEADPDIPDGVGLSLGGFTRFVATSDRLEVGDLEAQLGSTHVLANGVIHGTETNLAVALTSEDLRDLEFLYAGTSGAGTFSGEIRGRIAQPDLSGRFSVRGYEYGDWTFERIEGEAALASNELDLRDVRVLKGNSEIGIDGRASLTGGDQDLDITIVRLDADDIRPLLDQPLTGWVAGQAHLTSLDPAGVEASLRSDNLEYDGNRIGTASAEVVVDPAELRLTDVRVEQDDGFLSGGLVYDFQTTGIQLQFDAAGQSIGSLEWLGLPSGFEGTLQEASFEVVGPRRAPMVKGDAVIEALRFGEQEFGEVALRVENIGRSVSAHIENGESLRIQLQVDPALDDYPFHGTAQFTDYDGSQLAGTTPGSLIATGTVSFDGVFGDLSSFRGMGRVTALVALFENQEIRVADPFDLSFDSTTLRISTVRLGGPASLEMAGTIGLSADAPLDLSLLGRIDLSLISSEATELRTSGHVRLDGRIGGTLANPELDGTGRLEEVSLGHDSLFLGLSSLNGALRFDRNLVILNDIRGSAGGGNVTVDGSIRIEDSGPRLFDIRLEGTNVRVRTPEGLRTVFDAVLNFRGTPAEPVLEGDLEVRSLSFNESFDAFLELFGSGPEGVATSGPLDAMALAIHIEGDRNIRIENEMARVESRLDLDVGGTFGTPSLTGHVEASSGTFDFQGNRYRITRGNVDFVDPTGIEPQLDVQAEADLRRYRILLLISGPADDLRLSMSSDPPLSELEIVSLIGGGRTREELAADQSANTALPTSEELFTGGAATILTDLLQSRVGSRLGVLSRVRVDPFLVGAENDALARLTISEQITRDLAVTYSQDLSSNRQQIIVIEYFLNADTSFIASRDETGALGLDIKLRKRFDR